MGQRGKPVIKCDLEGNEVAHYEDIHEACEKEGLTKPGLYNKIATGAKGKGCCFRFGHRPSAHEIRDKPKTPPREENPFPWEKNGVFNPDGWTEACIY